MKSQTKKHSTKNTSNQVSQNAYAVHFDNRHRTGASGANFLAKKNIAPKSINPIQTWYLLILKVHLAFERLLLLAKAKK